MTLEMIEEIKEPKELFIQIKRMYTVFLGCVHIRQQYRPIMLIKRVVFSIYF